MASLDHQCLIRTHHLPLPHLYCELYLIPIEWQQQLYGAPRIRDSVTLCPTHDAHARLAVDAATGKIVFGEETPFNRRQFGRELWSLAEDAALWLRERREMISDDFDWRIAPDWGANTFHAKPLPLVVDPEWTRDPRRVDVRSLLARGASPASYDE